MKKLIRAVGILSLVVAIAVIGVSLVRAAGESPAPIPTEINYQGYLTDDSGIPLDGSYTVVFSLYDQATGGNPLWEQTCVVDVSAGLFSVPLKHLGEENFSGDRFLGVQVGDDDEMIPRQQLTSVAYALWADHANYANTLDGIDSDDLVHAAGDAMTGALTVPADGLSVAADQLVLAHDNVGIGTAFPSAKLEVDGDVVFNEDGELVSFRAGGDDLLPLFRVARGYDDGGDLVTVNTNASGNVKLAVGGTLAADAFIGDGSGLSGLPATRTTAGTWYMKNLADTRTNWVKMPVQGTPIDEDIYGLSTGPMKYMVMPYDGWIVAMTFGVHRADQHTIQIKPTINDADTGIEFWSNRDPWITVFPEKTYNFSAGDVMGVRLKCQNNGPLQWDFLFNAVVTITVEYR